MKKLSYVIPLLFIPLNLLCQPKPSLYWDFENADGYKIIENITKTVDSVAGNFKLVETGYSGKAYKPDGFTSCMHVNSTKSLNLDGSFTVEACITQAAYPWNWVPVIASIQEGRQRQEGTRGFYFAVGPRGQLGMELYIEGELYRCISDDYLLSLYKWNHVAAIYTEGKGIELYIDGNRAGFTAVNKKFVMPPSHETRVGMNFSTVKPSDIHRQFGTLPYWFSIDGAIDELRVFNSALDSNQLNTDFILVGKKAPFPERKMPEVKKVNRFGASYTKLKYYDEWDHLWPVADHPDVVVNFEDSDVRLVFWRGTRYSPAWISEGDFWMADQSVEAWNNTEGCYEHMQDRHCKYSHVRILENTPARVLVHWRYAPVSAYNLTWNIDEKTGWECWVDEYYYIYPDGSAIRHVEWNTGSLGYPRQFQESIPLAGPGQLRGDIMDNPWLTVANQQGVKQVYEYVEDPQISEKKEPEKPNIQKHNFRSEYDPFIIFESGNKMNYLGDRDITNLARPGSCNHWPVGQAYCDGRTGMAADRPTSFLGFPISNPVITEEKGRSWWNGLYGMTDKSVDYLVRLSRSWNNSPEAEVLTDGYSTPEYDRSQRAYKLTKTSGNEPLILQFKASDNRPILNPVIIIDNPGILEGNIMIDGRDITDDYRKGFVSNLDSESLILYLFCEYNRPVEIKIF